MKRDDRERGAATATTKCGSFCPRSKKDFREEEYEEDQLVGLRLPVSD
jgi:hypothetical protein